MKQIIEIEIPEGKIAKLQNNKIIFEDIKPQLPKTWEEFCKTHRVSLNDAYIACDSKARTVASVQKRNPYYDRYLLPNKEAAEQYIALMQLHQLRDCYRQGWKPDWYNDSEIKYCIVHTKSKDNQNNLYSIGQYGSMVRFLSFETKQIAEEFLTRFKDLIEKAGDLI